MATAASTTPSVHNFGRSSPFSLGVEEEFQLMHRETGELVSRIDTVLGKANESELQHIKPELMQSVIEGSTRVCANAAEAHEDLAALRTRLSELATESDCLIGSAGTHPFSRYEFQKVTDKQRYVDLMAQLQWVAQRELIFGLHVHVGMPDPQTAISVFNGMRPLLPQILALSVNSPFWQGRYTGLHSCRPKIFETFPRSGTPPAFDSWDHWCSMIDRAVKIGCFNDFSYIWWDLRVHPRYGTIEVRVSDAQTKLGHTVAIAALVQSLCAWIADTLERGGSLTPAPPDMLIEENRWSACRHGLDADLIDFASDSRVPARDLVQQLVARAEPFARKLGSHEQLAGIDDILDTTGAQRQLDVYADSQSLTTVAHTIARETVDV